MAECAECGAEVELPRKVSIGEIVECPECESMLEVADVSPLTLEVADDVEDEGSGDEGGAEEDEDWLQ